MGTWRGKLIFLLVVYFAGFATAIYTLAPTPENQAARFSEKSFSCSALKTDEFAQSFNSGMHKCIDFSKELACRMGKLIKQKINEIQLEAKS